MPEDHPASDPAGPRTDPGPELPDVRMHLHTPADPGEAVVVSNEPCVPRKASCFLRHVVLDVSRTRLAGAFRAGQSFGVLPPGHDAQGRPHKVRLYSIASPTAGEAGDGATLSTTVKRLLVEDPKDHKLHAGVASNYLCDLQVGDTVRITGPSGKRFVLPSRVDDHDYLFFATGTGIAPFRGMVRDLLSAGASSRIVLVVGSPYSTDVPYECELRELEARHANFTFLTAISRGPQRDGGPPMYVDARLETHAELMNRVLRSSRGLVYACGIAGMELGLLRTMARTLPPDDLDRYIRVDPAAGPSDTWERRMIQREIRPTRRVFLEVY